MSHNRSKKIFGPKMTVSESLSTIGKGCNEDPFGMDSEEEPNADSRKQRAQNRAKQNRAAAHKEQELDKIMAGAGIDVEETEMSLSEKKAFASVIRASKGNETIAIGDSSKIKLKGASKKKYAVKSWASVLTYSGSSSDTSCKETGNADSEDDKDEHSETILTTQACKTNSGTASHSEAHDDGGSQHSINPKKGITKRLPTTRKGQRLLCAKKEAGTGAVLDSHEGVRSLRGMKHPAVNTSVYEKLKKLRSKKNEKSKQILLSNVMTVSNDDSDMSDPISETPTTKKDAHAKRSSLEVEVKVHVRISPTNSQKKSGGASTVQQTLDSSETTQMSQEQDSQSMLSTDKPSRGSVGHAPALASRMRSEHMLCQTRDDPGIQSSPDLFQTQPVQQLVEVASTADEDETLVHATNVFGAIADNYRYDVFYETARQRKADGKRGVEPEKDKRTVTKGKCPFCSGTPSPPFRELVNKKKLKLKLRDPVPYFAPPGVSAASYTQTISRYIQTYRLRLRKHQKKSRVPVRWPRPVQPGRHFTSTLFTKALGQVERPWVLFEIDDRASPDPFYSSAVEVSNNRVLPDLDGAFMRSVRKRQHQVSDDESSSDFIMALPTTSKNNGKGTKRSKVKQADDISATERFSNNNFRSLRRREKREKVVSETQRFNAFLENDSSNDGFSVDPQVGVAKFYGTNNATASRASPLSGEEELQKRTVKDTKHSPFGLGSPELFKLNVPSTAVESDEESLESEVRRVLSTGKERIPVKVGGRHQRTAEATSSKSTGDIKESGDIILFESPEEERPDLESPIRGSSDTARRKFKFQKRKKEMTKISSKEDEETVRIFRKFRSERESPPEVAKDESGSGEGDSKPGHHDTSPSVRRGGSRVGQQGDITEDVKLAEAILKVKQRVEKPKTIITVAVPQVKPAGRHTVGRSADAALAHAPLAGVEEEEETEKMVECPMCQSQHPLSIIEQHAAECNGPASPVDQQEHYSPAQVRRQSRRETHAKRRHTAAFDQGSTSETHSLDFEEEPKWLNRKRIGRTSPPNMRDDDEDDEPADQCPICHRSMPLTTLERHVNECLTRQEQGLPLEEEPGRRTRGGAPGRGLGAVAARRPLHPTNTGSTRRAAPSTVIDLSDSDDEISLTSDASRLTRKPLLQTRQSQMLDFVMPERGNNTSIKITPLKIKDGAPVSTKSTTPRSTPKGPSSARRSDLMSLVPRLSDPSATFSPPTVAPRTARRARGGAARRCLRLGVSQRGGRGISCTETNPAETNRGENSHSGTAHNAISRKEAGRGENSRSRPGCGRIGRSGPRTDAAPSEAPSGQTETDYDYSHGGSESETSVSESISISDAEDDVPLGTSLKTASNGSARSTEKVAPSPVSSFRPISALQGSNKIDFRNQFHQARGRGDPATRKRISTGRKKRKRKKRTSVGSARGRRAKAEATVQVKKMKEEI